MLIAIGGFIHGAGTITYTDSNLGSWTKMTATWSTNASTASTWRNGEIRRITIYPGTSADNYDMVITDSSGVDVLAGLGANLTTNITVTVCPGIQVRDSGGAATNMIPFVFDGPLTVTVSGVGSAELTTSGYVDIYYAK